MQGGGVNWMTGYMWIVSITWVLLIVFGIAAIAWALARRGGASAPRDHEERAMATLRERFARGEIDEREYRERRQTLDHP